PLPRLRSDQTQTESPDRLQRHHRAPERRPQKNRPDHLPRPRRRIDVRSLHPRKLPPRSDDRRPRRPPPNAAKETQRTNRPHQPNPQTDLGISDRPPDRRQPNHDRHADGHPLPTRHHERDCLPRRRPRRALPHRPHAHHVGARRHVRPRRRHHLRPLQRLRSQRPQPQPRRNPPRPLRRPPHPRHLRPLLRPHRTEASPPHRRPRHSRRG